MKKIACSGPGCSSRRVHHEYQDTPRGTQYIDVEDTFPKGKKAYCSLTCAAMDGALVLFPNTAKKAQ